MSKKQTLLLTRSLNIPSFDTLDGLSKITGLSSRLLFCLSQKTERYYKTISVPKRNGDMRIIHSPSYSLHIMQLWILRNILDKVIPSDRSMAFRKGKAYGYLVNALCHIDTLYAISIDLQDFFPSITADKVFTIFSNLGYNSFASTILTNLCTLDGILPQGSACSPALSNLVCLALDARLVGLCEKRGIRFTRYADDMYFSCDDQNSLKRILPIIRKIIESEGFVINDKKTRFQTPSNKKEITGVIVSRSNSSLLPELKARRQFKRTIRVELFRAIVTGDYANKAHILGEIAHVNYIENDYLEKIKKYIAKTASGITYFNELVVKYNSNKFYKDLNDVEFSDPSDENPEYILCLRKERKAYFAKNLLSDICDYSHWPDNDVTTPIEEIDESNWPF